MRTARLPLSAAIFTIFVVAGLALGMHLPGLHAHARRTATASPALPGVVPVSSTVATAHPGQLPLYSSPGAGSPSQTLASPDALGQARVFLVKAQQGSWLDVYLPQRPNGATAWVPLQDVTLSTDSYAVTVSTGRHVLTAWKSGKAIFTTPAAVGKSSTPTPQGAFYLAEVLRQPNPKGAYGPYAFGTSAFSNVLYSFGGGPGQIGLHGTDEPGSIGNSASHGCIRVGNDVITQLVGMLPLGTPIIVGA